MEVTNKVAEMSVTCRDLRPVAFNARGAGSGVLPIVPHPRVMESFITIARRGVVDEPVAAETCRLPVDAVVHAFVDAKNMVEWRTRENLSAMPGSTRIIRTYTPPHLHEARNYLMIGYDTW